MARPDKTTECKVVRETVEEFLARGGVIEVVDSSRNAGNVKMKSVDPAKAPREQTRAEYLKKAKRTGWGKSKRG